MYSKPVAARCLHDRAERAQARMAMRATLDTIHGGARALVLAERLERMGSKLPHDEIVGDVYSRSTGRTSEQWGAWECGECGSVYLGRENADRCCSCDECADLDAEINDPDGMNRE